MFQETKCPVCNALMIGTIASGGTVMYLCPNHSFGETIGKADGVHMHISDKMVETGEDIRKAIFNNFKDYHV